MCVTGASLRIEAVAKITHKPFQSIVLSYLDHINRCNEYSLKGRYPFLIDGVRFGFVTNEFAQTLNQFPDVFILTGSELRLSEALTTPKMRTDAVATVLEECRRQGMIQAWNDELFAVKNDFSDPEVMAVQRAAVAHFGLRAYGVHVDGLVNTRQGEKLWIATRAANKTTFPGMLDHIVAGGQPAGMGLLENVIKEADEEASIPESLASKAQLKSTITYCTESQNGLKPDTLFAFDLTLPEDFVPQSNDGEVASFELLDLDEVAEIIDTTERFKPNCNLVIIDLLIRKGVIKQQSSELSRLLRQPLP